MLATLLVPFALTLVLSLALRVLAKEKSERAAVIPAAIGILGCWAFLARPGWVPVDDVRRILHIGVGAGLLGLALDALRPHRVVTAILAGGFVVGCALASVTGGIIPKGPLSLRDGVIIAALAATAYLTLARFDAMRERPLSLAILLTLVAFGLALLASIAQEAMLAKLSLILASGLAGYLVFVAVTGGVASDGMILIGGASALGVVWALAQGHPELRLALLCLPLVLFAEATALRVPLPVARISAFLYPLVLGLLVGLPLGLAALISFVTTGP